jgi:hypothetical protein
MPILVAGRFGLCPSCWWIARTSFAIGMATLATLGFLAGIVVQFLR